MEEQASVETQAPENVTAEASQPGQEASVDSANQGDAQQASESVSRRDYNKAIEASRKMTGELNRYKQMIEEAKGAIEMHRQLSQSKPELIQKIMDMVNGKESAQEAKVEEEDDSWLNEFDPRVANLLRELKGMKGVVSNDMASRLAKLEQEASQRREEVLVRNEITLNKKFDDFLLQNKLFEKLDEEATNSNLYKMVQDHVLMNLLSKYKDPRAATMEDMDEALNAAKSGLDALDKKILSQKVQTTLPPSGSKTGLIPTSKQITQEDRINFWSTPEGKAFAGIG